MLYFVRGRAKSGKTSYVIQKIAATRAEGTLLVVPEQYSHTAERNLCTVCGNSVRSYAEVTSFRWLSSTVKAQLGGLAVRCIDNGRRILLLHNVIRNSETALATLGRVGGRPELLEKVLNTIDEFKSYGVKPASLMRAAKDASPALGTKLSDLAVLYAGYESAFSEDEEDVYDELFELSENLKKHSFFDGKTLYFDGFSGFTAPELDILESALRKAKDVYVTFETSDSDDAEAENGIFKKPLETIARLRERAERNGVACEDVHLTRREDSSIAYLDRTLFKEVTEPYTEDGSAITLARADGMFEECELAAAYVLDTVRKENLRWRDFCVAAADGSYMRCAERVFSRYGIPVYMNEKSSLPDKPIVALIASALDCIERNFHTDAVLAYLKTGFTGVCLRSLDIFENYLYTWTPRGSMWTREEGFAQNPFGIRAEETEESQARLALVNRIRGKVRAPIIRLRDSLKRDMRGEACAEALYEFVNDIGLSRRCAAYARLMEYRGNLKEAREYDRLWEILCEAIDSIGRAVGDEVLTLSELSALLRIVISQYELGTIPVSLDCVNICDVAHAGGASRRVQLILGASEGAFPPSADAVGFLTDSDRNELSDLGVELAPGLAERISEQFRVIHAAMCAATEKLYVSSAALSASGEETAESTVLSRLRILFPSHSEGFGLHEARMMSKLPCFDESVSAGGARAYFEEDPDYREKLLLAEKNARVPRGPIAERENITALFGKEIRLSASRADLFSSCRYAYFMKYGLRAEPKRRAELSALEAGTLMHYVLERVISALSKEKGYDVIRAKELAAEACREFVKENLSGAAEPSARTEFLIRRVEKTVMNAVEEICGELASSLFKPCEFELKFSDDGDVPALRISDGDVSVSLRGAVDRVDSYEKDGKLYIRVVDYKSGKKAFSIDETINGIGMQMLLYLFALEEFGAARYGREVVPAGVLYVPLSGAMTRTRDGKRTVRRREGLLTDDLSVLRAMDTTENADYLPIGFDKSGKLKKQSAVLSADGFAKVRERMRDILVEIGAELGAGEIGANPYFATQRTACDYCDYKNACQFDEVDGDDCRRDLYAVRLKDLTEQDGGDTDEC